MYAAIRVGEAQHPGPGDHTTINVAITNPTTIGPKVEVFESLCRDEGLDIISVAETAATGITQKQFSYQMHRSGYKTCWSAPVPEFRSRIDGQESTRGKALGVACISHLPMRIIQGTISDQMQLSSRILHTVVDLGDLQIQCVTLYGYASGNPHSVSYTHELIQQALHAVDQVSLPYVIMGDFNLSPMQTTMADVLLARNIRDLNMVHQDLYGLPLPPTCKGVTSPDTALFSGDMAPWISRVDVLPVGHFDTHQVVLFRMQVPVRARTVRQLTLPRTWLELPIDESRLQDAFESLEGATPSTLEAWGQHVEHVIDQAFRSTQADQHSGTGCSLRGLPKKYRGRCQPQKFRDVPRKLLLKLGRSTDYNPTVEILRYATAAQVKQVRRLRTFLNRLQKFQSGNLPSHVMGPLMQEWDAILRAPGFGDFVSWCMDQPELGPPSLGIPTVDYASLLLQFVTHQCNQSLADDAKFRRNRIKYERHLDKVKVGNRAAFSMMRRDYVEPLTEMLHTQEDTAVLVPEGELFRTYVAHPRQFVKDASILVDQHVCQVLDKDDHSLLIKSTVPPPLDSEVDVRQDLVLYDSPHLFDKLTSFWCQYWNVSDPDRDVPSEFQQFLDAVQTLPEFHVEVASVEHWESAIKSLKPSTARGVDGISARELQSLPKGLIVQLASIMASMSVFPSWFMLTLTVALPKVAGSVRVGQIRPITIFAQLYRTWSRVISQQILCKFSGFLPSGVTGFLRQRGPIDASMAFAFFLEQAHHASDSYSGLVLDLVKCFNTICRVVAGAAMAKLGVPAWVISMWSQSLRRMTRVWMINRQCSESFSTNNGCPEGDSMSIVAILSLGFLWLQSLETADINVKATCYADNWGWTVPQPEAHSAALVITQSFTSLCRMQIDWGKSWIWANDGPTCAAVTDIFHGILPEVDIHCVTTAQDLGCVHTYKGCPKLGQFVQRLAKSHSMLQRLQTMPHDCCVKAQLVMGAAYPAAFYGVEVLPIGEHHLQTMRPKVTNAVLGVNSSRNSALALNCFPGLDDPLVYIIMKVIRSARRFLATLPREQIAKFLQIAANHSARFCDCRGPAGCLSYYLGLVDWVIDAQGDVLVADGVILPLQFTSAKTWKHWLEIARQPGLLERYTQRSILHGLVIDTHETKRVLASFDPPALTQLVNELSGAFQLETQKVKWTDDATTQCRFCDQEDSRFHRLYECMAFAHVRFQYQDLLNQFAADESLVHELPVLFQHPNHDVLHLMAYQHVEAILEPDMLRKLLVIQQTGTMLHFYTDGSLMFPSQPTSRHAAYSLVVDVCQHDIHRQEQVDLFRVTGAMPQTLQLLAVARVTGRQTIYRAELSAVVKLCEAMRRACLHVDSQSVLDTVLRCQHTESVWDLQGDADFDLVYRLWHALRLGVFHFIKVAAHKDPGQLQDWRDVYRCLGNKLANDTAIHANKTMYLEQAKMWAAMGEEVAASHSQLRQLYRLHLDLHAARAKQEQLDKMANSDGLEAAQPQEQRILLEQWTVSEKWAMPQLRINNTGRSVMGQRLTNMLLDWLKLLRWPAMHVSVIDDPGVTYLELAVSWMLYHGCYIPVKRKRADGQTFLFLADSAENAAAHCVTLNELGWMISYWLHQVSQLCHPWLIPDVPRGNCRSLYRLGTRNHACGFLRRPTLPNQIDVISKLASLTQLHGEGLSKQGIAVSVRANVDVLRGDLIDGLQAKQERVKREVQQTRKCVNSLISSG
eukprot:Skav204105  [mRNA]  locus=scaffold1472:214438:219609:+ [translate_table: standard]